MSRFAVPSRPARMSARRVVGAFLAILLSLVLVGAVVQPANAEETSPSETPADIAPLLPEESEEVVDPLGEKPAPVDLSDEPDAEAVTPPPSPGPDADPNAQREESEETFEDFDRASADVVDRDEFSVTYDGPGDAKLTEFSTDPLSVEVDGAWKPIETDLTGRGPFALLGRGGAEVVQHPLEPVFAENATETPLLTVTEGSHEISFSLVDAKSSMMQRDLAPWSEEKEHVRYPSVFENTDLAYEVTTSGVKEVFELAVKPGSTITFSTFERGGWVYLQQAADAHGANVAVTRGTEQGFAELVWGQQDRNLMAMFQ